VEPILDISQKSDEEIQNIFSEYSVALTPDEGRQVVELLGRNPTLTEATVWGIQGSEHSSYKSSRNYLKKLPTKGEHVLLGPGEDSGVIKFHTAKNGKTYGLVVAHESHNHPSQVVPYEGAATGVGGICRDIACMGARVIGALDALRFGDVSQKETKRIFAGVTAGVGGYGNPLGVPNLGGDVRFDESFDENCLVNVVALGVLDFADLLHSYVPENAAQDGYEYILVGKPTDRSGFGGSSFASATLSEDDKEKNKGAVQEPNPFLERHLFAAFNDLFARLKKRGDLNRIALKDLGAGGVLCATVELVAEQGFGAEVDVEAIHTAEKDLPAAVILCAETQERFCFAVPPDLSDFVLDHFNVRWDFSNVSAGARASKIGRVTDSGVYTATYRGEKVCNAKALDITEGIVVDRPLRQMKPKNEDELLPTALNVKELALDLIASENICSERSYSETYDQTVQGNTVLTRDEAEGAVFTPLGDYEELEEDEQKICSVVAVSGPARVGRICPRSQAELAVCQAVLKCAAVGGETLGLTDCLNYGNPEIPEQMWQFAQGVEGLSGAAKSLNTPFVSGNVSLYNSSHTASVSPSAIIGAFGKIDPQIIPRRNAFQKEGNSIYLLGKRSDQLGGSEVLRIIDGRLGKNPPSVDFEEVLKIKKLLLDPGVPFQSASVITEGGLLASLLKMSARSNIGIQVSAEYSLPQWLSENPGVVLEIAGKDESAFLQKLQSKTIAAQKIGEVGGESVSVQGIGTFDLKKISDLFFHSLRRKR
jgi:phosphoribosylformylglycinamidine synthase II